MIKLTGLIKEAIYGSNAIVYHRTREEDLIRKVFDSGFKPGDGDMYGKGFYATYEIDSQLNDNMVDTYGHVVVKFKVNIDNFLIFDWEPFIKSPQRIKLPKSTKETFIQDQIDFYKIKKVDGSRYVISHSQNNYTSNMALRIVTDVQLDKFVSGIIFTGNRDGQVIVVYDYDKLITPLSFTVDDGKNWIRYKPSKEYIQKSITDKISSASGLKGDVGLRNIKKSIEYQITRGDIKKASDRINGLSDTDLGTLFKSPTIVGLLYTGTDSNIIEEARISYNKFIEQSGVDSIRKLKHINPVLERIFDLDNDPGITLLQSAFIIHIKEPSYTPKTVRSGALSSPAGSRYQDVANMVILLDSYGIKLSARTSDDFLSILLSKSFGERDLKLLFSKRNKNLTKFKSAFKSLIPNEVIISFYNIIPELKVIYPMAERSSMVIDYVSNRYKYQSAYNLDQEVPKIRMESLNHYFKSFGIDPHAFKFTGTDYKQLPELILYKLDSISNSKYFQFIQSFISSRSIPLSAVIGILNETAKTKLTLIDSKLINYLIIELPYALLALDDKIVLSEESQQLLIKSNPITFDFFIDISEYVNLKAQLDEILEKYPDKDYGRDNPRFVLYKTAKNKYNPKLVTNQLDQSLGGPIGQYYDFFERRLQL